MSLMRERIVRKMKIKIKTEKRRGRKIEKKRGTRSGKETERILAVHAI